MTRDELAEEVVSLIERSGMRDGADVTAALLMVAASIAVIAVGLPTESGAALRDGAVEGMRAAAMRERAARGLR